VLPQTIQLTVRQTDNGPVLDCGDGIFVKEYVQVRGIKHVVSLLKMKDKISLYMEANPVTTAKERYSIFNRAVFSITHVPQRQFIKLVQGKLFEAFIKPIPEKIKMRLCFGPSGLSPRRVKAVHQVLPLLSQALEDKQDNILPYILQYKKSPEELKAYFGKGLWKRVCALSFSRNKALANYVASREPSDSYSIESHHRAKLIEAIALPTTLLNSFTTRFHDYEELLYAKLHCKGEWNSPVAMQSICTTYGDTVRMRRLYDNKDSKGMLTWSTKRLNAEHEAYVKRSFISKYSAERFQWADQIPIGPFSYKGYEVTPLFSALEIGMEGQAMNHCVGMYANRAADGHYLVFSVKKNERRYSTIGLRMVRGGAHHTSVAFDQHYMAYNKPVEDPNAEEIPAFIIQSILKSQGS
jgi:hypothetical protein